MPVNLLATGGATGLRESSLLACESLDMWKVSFCQFTEVACPVRNSRLVFKFGSG